MKIYIYKKFGAPNEALVPRLPTSELRNWDRLCRHLKIGQNPSLHFKNLSRRNLLDFGVKPKNSGSLKANLNVICLRILAARYF